MKEVDTIVFKTLFKHGEVQVGEFDYFRGEYKRSPEGNETLKEWMETDNIDWEKSTMESGEEKVFVATYADDNTVDVIEGKIVSKDGEELRYGVRMHLKDLAELMASLMSRKLENPISKNKQQEKQGPQKRI